VDKKYPKLVNEGWELGSDVFAALGLEKFENGSGEDIREADEERQL
jgi:hypothetical protein